MINNNNNNNNIYTGGQLNTAHINTMIKSSFFMTLEQLIGLLSTALTMSTRPLIRGVQSTPALPTNTLQ